ncbi:hypothetical protein CSC79_04955 [Pseudoalteromonas sp. 3D05]|nr:hypothetical protein CSC79_04955 [Pseudoalteromonas sp. 3D05]
MLNRLKGYATKGLWQSLAIIIVMFIAGPEIVISMELMALVEVMGASSFVLMYFSRLRLACKITANRLSKFECYSLFFIPSFANLKQMPGLLYHTIPHRLCAISFLTLITAIVLLSYIQLFYAV